MEKLFNAWAAVVLIIGGIYPLAEGAIPERGFAFALISMAILLSVALGFWWLKRIKEASLQATSSLDANGTIDAALKRSASWLQAARPARPSHERARGGESILEIARSRFLMSYLFVIGVVAAYMVVAILTNGGVAEGLFGSVLRLAVGKSVAVMFCLYLSISSFSFFMIGFFAQLQRGGK